MESWVFDVLGCAAPGCSGKLRPTTGDGPPRDGIVRCKKCKSDYPVLGGVPILVPAPDEWVAAYHDAIISSLAEARRLTRAGQKLIDQLSARAPRTEPLRFGNDWVPSDTDDHTTSAFGPSEDAATFDAFLKSAASPTLPERLLALLEGRSLGTVLELGPGAGALSRHLRHHSKRLVVADLSLRATLRALAACKKGDGAPVEGAVVDAEQLPLRRGAARTVVAANLIDLLDHPAAFLSGVADGLPNKGRLLLSTPSPGFGFPEGDAEILDGLVERSGLVITKSEDGLPWIRAHDPRHFEVYFVRALVAEHA
jgi:SAM-dependent methyltransferase